jgi:hypothetical protein
MKRAADAQLTRDTADEEDSGSVSLASIPEFTPVTGVFNVI